MKLQLIKSVKTMAVYIGILALLALLGLSENMDIKFWLFPFELIFVIDWYSDHRSFSNTREMFAVIVNILIIFTLHFFAYAPERKWLRVTLTSIISTVVVLWYLFSMFAVIAMSAG